MVNRERQLNDLKDSWVFEISHQTRPEKQSHSSTKTCAQYSLELWKWTRYNGITMLLFSRAIAIHGSLFVYATTFFEIGV